MTYLWLGCFGIGVGVLSGLLGIGGGIALVPGLMLLFGFSQAEAQGTSLAVLIPPIGIFAALVYWHNGFVRLPVVGWVAGGFVVGAFIGALLVPHVPQGALRTVFGMLLVYVGFTFLVTPPRAGRRRCCRRAWPRSGPGWWGAGCGAGPARRRRCRRARMWSITFETPRLCNEKGTRPFQPADSPRFTLRCKAHRTDED
jgi:uncharacterized membrane protein YfcA